MIGCATGDALGASSEGLRLDEREIKGSQFHSRWTDDTHMMLGLAESLITNEGFNGHNMTWTFIKNWEQEPWRGYGPGPPQVFKMVKRGIPWTRAAKKLYGGEGSYGNGAAMRVAPIGLLYHEDPERVREIAYKSAEITHTHVLGKEGAAIQAYAVAVAVKAKEKLNPYDFLEDLTQFTMNDLFREKLVKARSLLSSRGNKQDVIKNLGTGIEAFNSIPTAVYSFAKNCQDFSQAVVYAVGLGGDTDTIGAMTGGIAGAYHGIEKIPANWKDKLEKNDYIRDLASKLWRIERK